MENGERSPYLLLSAMFTGHTIRYNSGWLMTYLLQQIGFCSEIRCANAVNTLSSAQK